MAPQVAKKGVAASAQRTSPPVLSAAQPVGGALTRGSAVVLDPAVAVAVVVATRVEHEQPQLGEVAAILV